MASKDRYPQYLVIPGVDDFCHGKFAAHVKDDKDHLYEFTNFHYPHKDRYDCGVRCCYVGWTALAMGESGGEPERIQKTTTREFLILSIMEVAERFEGYGTCRQINERNTTPIERWILEKVSNQRLGWIMSDLFEEGSSFIEFSHGDNYYHHDLSVKEEYLDDDCQISPENAHLLYVKVAESLGYDVRHAKNAC